MPPVPPAEDPLDAAARVLAREDRGCTPDEFAQSAAWRRASPVNAAALATLNQVWHRLDTLRHLCPHDGDTPDPDLLAPGRDERGQGPDEA